jgi:hypothetical protein
MFEPQAPVFIAPEFRSDEFTELISILDENGDLWSTLCSNSSAIPVKTLYAAKASTDTI